MNRSRAALSLASLLMFVGAPLCAQWTEQSITLQPGWNSVHLEVEPATTNPAELFAGLPIESVWAFNRRSGGLQFLVSPSQLVPEDADWLVWFPPSAEESAVTDLFAVTGGRPYLVKLGGSSAETLRVLGKPTTRRARFVTDSPSLVGFTVGDPGPTFAQFFAASPAHSGQGAWRLSAAGDWQALNPGSDRLRAGEGFWINTSGASSFEGPFEVVPPTISGVDFGDRSVTVPLTLRNPGATPKTLTLELLPSLDPPVDNAEVLAGAVPLSCFVFDTASSIFGQVPITEPFTVSVPANGDLTLTLGVDRRDLAAFTPPVGKSAAYQGILQVSDGTGSVRRVGVRAKGFGEGGGSRASAGRGSEVVDLRPGLWVGAVSVNGVSQPANAGLSGSTEPLPAPQSFQFRILIHVDGSGNATLLQQVFLMFKPAVTVPNPEDPEVEDVVEPATFVLVTDDALLPQFTGAVLRDGVEIGRRISSSAFSFRNPAAMATNTGGGRRNYEVTLDLDYDDPLNPFKHRYHPDHNNRNEQFDQQLPEGLESFDVSRALVLTLSPEDLEGLDSAGYGDTVISGTFRETITGIHRDPINVGGIFRLEHVSDVEVLNDGL